MKMKAKTTQLGPNWKTYEQMNDWERMEHRLGRHMISIISNGKVWWRIDK